jgi:hypothetical protein
MVHILPVRFIPGDEEKESMKARGITFEQVATAPLLDTLPNPGHPDQMLLIVEIGGYVHVAPCERRGDAWRIITAYPSRKYQKRYRP